MTQFRVYIECENNGAFVELVTAKSVFDAFDRGRSLVVKRMTLPPKICEFKVTKVKQHGR